MQRRLSFFQRIATAVSGLDPRRNGTSDPEGLGRGLARSSQKPGSVRRSIQIVAALSTMTAASCLITTDPEFEPPAKTPPFFLPDTASPNADRVLQINDGDSGIKFSAFMQSEDAGAELSARLYLDYGGAFPSGHVYDLHRPRPRSSRVWFMERTVLAGCQRHLQRRVRGPDVRGLPSPHADGDPRQLRRNGCPAEEGDYDTQTWIVQNCAANEYWKDSLGGKELFDASKCPPVPADLSTKCPRSELSSANVGGSP